MVCESRREFFLKEESDKHWLEFPSVAADLVGAQSIHFVKGWTRSVSLIFVLDTIKNLDLLEVFAIHFPEFMRTAGTLHGIFKQYGNAADAIDASRSITLQSTSVRQVPNCFNQLHQVERKMILGQSQDFVLHQLQNPGILKSVFGMGKMEAKAVCNLLTQMPTSIVDKLKRAASKYGMHKGPFSHAAIASGFLCEGAVGDFADVDWCNDCKMEEQHLHWLVDRVLQEFEDKPPAMRKTASPDILKAHVTDIGCLIKHYAQAFKDWPQEIYDKEVPRILKTWALGLMDGYLQDMAKKSVVDPMLIPDFAEVYNRVEAEIVAKAKAQHDALQQAVEASTFEAMDYDLEEDKKDLIKYGSELLQKKNTWSFYLDVQNVNVNQWE